MERSEAERNFCILKKDEPQRTQRNTEEKPSASRSARLCLVRCSHTIKINEWSEAERNFCILKKR